MQSDSWVSSRWVHNANKHTRTHRARRHRQWQKSLETHKKHININHKCLSKRANKMYTGRRNVLLNDRSAATWSMKIVNVRVCVCSFSCVKNYIIWPLVSLLVFFVAIINTKSIDIDDLLFIDRHILIAPKCSRLLPKIYTVVYHLICESIVG